MIRHRCPESVVVAGILHDVVEHTRRTIEDVRHSFGEGIAGIVEAATKKDKSLPWKERKQETIERIEEARLEVLLVECADKLNSIRAIRDDYESMGQERTSGKGSTHQRSPSGRTTNL